MIVVDRIEGDYAVLEIAGRMVDVALALLPPELRDSLREGDRLIFARAPVEAPVEELLEELPLDEPPLEDAAPLQGSPAPDGPAPEAAAPSAPEDGAAILAALKAAHPQGAAEIDL